MPSDEKRMNSQVANFFHGYAADFDSIYGTSGGLVNAVVNRLFRKSMKSRFVKTLEACEPIAGRQFLDVGCGPGHYSVALARMGARAVLGVDFAARMLEIARERAQVAGVADEVRFEQLDFLTHTFQETFDCVIVMGFMDYVADARTAVTRVLDLARDKAFFSFPAAGGFLAWQREFRYRGRCPLFLYSRPQIERLFADIGGVSASIEKIDRDFFVTAIKA